MVPNEKIMEEMKKIALEYDIEIIPTQQFRVSKRRYDSIPIVSNVIIIDYPSLMFTEKGEG